MESTVTTQVLLSELADKHRLRVVLDEDEELDLTEGDPRERILEELRDMMFLLRNAEQRQRA